MAGLVVIVACVMALCLGGADRAYAISQGQTFSKGGNVYKVTDYEPWDDDMGEVVLVKYGSADRSPSINTVSYGGAMFEVDAIGARAFDNAAGHRITSVTFGRNVDKIFTRAFYGCKKLKSINMRASDAIDIEWGRSGCYVDDIDIAWDAFSKAGTPSIKVKCGSGNAQYKKAFKRALLQTGMRSSVKVVR